MSENRARLNLITAFVVFGTVSIFVKYIDMPSSIISLVRGIIGSAFIFLYLLIVKKHVDYEGIKKNLLKLMINGILIGANWILLFESYRYTTVAVASLCYYFQPVLLTLVSPFFFKEKLTAKKVVCVLAAMLGMAFVSGVFNAGSVGSFKGIALALSSALFYTIVVIVNKSYKGIGSTEAMMCMLFFAGVIMIPYNFVTSAYTGLTPSAVSVVMLIILSLFHTGFAYVLYFTSMQFCKAQTIAILGYIDPIVSIILSVFLLREPFNLFIGIGALLIIGSMIVSELNLKKTN